MIETSFGYINEGYCEGSCKYHYPDTNSWAYKQCYQYCIKNMPK